MCLITIGEFAVEKNKQSITPWQKGPKQRISSVQTGNGTGAPKRSTCPVPWFGTPWLGTPWLGTIASLFFCFFGIYGALFFVVFFGVLCLNSFGIGRQHYTIKAQ